MSQRGSSTGKKQKTIDFFFTPSTKDPGSPDLKHFTTGRKIAQSSGHEDWMEEDWTNFDDEPIGNRKRQERLQRTDSDLDVKRRKDENDAIHELQNRTDDTMDEILEQWSTQKRCEMNRAFDLSSTEQYSAVVEELPVLVCGLDSPRGVQGWNYSTREVELFPFLLQDQIKDSAGRVPGDADFHKGSVFIPESFFKKNRISEGQKQWWSFKGANFDSLILFKVGKFYEMYEMDAHIGVEVLNLKFMKGEQPHCGFPEAAYDKMSTTLAQAGYKVAVVEQTETQEQFEQRKAILKQQRKSPAKVVCREKVAVLTKGTLTENLSYQKSSDSSYLLSVLQSASLDASTGPYLAFCAVDAASNQILLTEFQDDELLSILRTHLTVLEPVELIFPESDDYLNHSVRLIIQKILSNARINLSPLSIKGFPTGPQAAAALEAYFKTKETQQRPEVVQQLINQPHSHSLILQALGGVLNFLQEVLLDKAIVPNSNYRILKSIQDFNETQSDFVYLDSSALENLELLCNSEGKSQGSLFAFLDHCVTPFGKRLLKSWISQPLSHSSEILKRQNAVHDLLTIAADVTGKFRKRISSLGDLERLLNRLQRGSNEGRFASHVVLYEDTTKKKLKALIHALTGLQTLLQGIKSFEELSSKLTSPLLRTLITPGDGFPLMEAELDQLWNSTDWTEAEQTGRVIPSKGVVPDYDNTQNRIKELERHLEDYLVKFRSEIRASVHEVSYVSLRKDRYLIEVSDKSLSGVPQNFEFVSKRKGFSRYLSPVVKKLVQDLEKAETRSEELLNGVLLNVINAFVSHQELWKSAVATCAHLDVLMSLAMASCSLQGPMCCPRLLPERSPPVLKATQLRHPCLCQASNGTSVIPNNITLDGGLLVLTGANMGGKSTLLRQVCLATILAQMGALVPAESMELTPVDSIFVRMGAKDHIISGKSTFYVELSDTASMLKRATERSLVALDELGRGTATSDGEAIAYSVLEHIRGVIGARAMFATHYHSLAKESEIKCNVSVKHMACLLTPKTNAGDIQEDEVLTDVEDVTFLYQLADGVAPKSYGMNVAKLAGVPSTVVQSANKISCEMENQLKCKRRGQGPSEEGAGSLCSLICIAESLKNVNLDEQSDMECEILVDQLKKMINKLV
eukprot:g6348.t1